jgi:hypothetical protein
MTYLKTLARVAGLGLCVVAFAGTAFADPGNGNGGPEATPPGQIQKDETPAASAPAPAATPAPQAAAGQEQKAENQAEHAAKQAESQSAAQATAAKAAAPGQAKKSEQAASKPAKPAKAATPSLGQSANAHHHVIICHRTGSDSNPYVVINIPYTAWTHAHSDTTGSHPDKSGRSDKLLKDPASRPGSKDGFTKSGCGAAVAPSATFVTPPAQQGQTANVTTSLNTTITASTQATVQVSHATQASQPTAVGSVAAAVTPGKAATAKPAKAAKPASGVLGAVASAPKAVEQTAASGTLPFTGLPLWIAALIGATLLAAGLVLRRTA